MPCSRSGISRLWGQGCDFFLQLDESQPACPSHAPRPGLPARGLIRILIPGRILGPIVGSTSAHLECHIRTGSGTAQHGPGGLVWRLMRKRGQGPPATARLVGLCNRHCLWYYPATAPWPEPG
jgi:hypothetical protein